MVWITKHEDVVEWLFETGVVIYHDWSSWTAAADSESTRSDQNDLSDHELCLTGLERQNWDNFSSYPQQLEANVVETGTGLSYDAFTSDIETKLETSRSLELQTSGFDRIVADILLRNEDSSESCATNLVVHTTAGYATKH